MNKKRYAIVRVDNTQEGAKWLNLFFEIFKKRKVVVKLGDTKEQLIRKVAQVMFRRKLKLYKKIWGGEMGSIERKDIYEQCLELAKEIVEFLGVEE